MDIHIPPFVYNTAPTLVPGGGAEVIPLANGDWFASNGFEDPSFGSAAGFSSGSSTGATGSYAQPVDGYHGQQQEQRQQALSGVEHELEEHHSENAPFSFELPPPPPLHQHQHHPQPAQGQQSLQTVTSHHHHHHHRIQPHLQPDLSVFLASSPTSGPGLPVYSTTGFDLLSLLARVATRPNPRVVLGPVDLTCSFVVVDTRRFDSPIVYCSPSFCELTGYAESEILGRNCRFLQAPGGNLGRGDERRYCSPNAVGHLKKCLLDGKECQTTMVNYKKDGTEFVNLLTVVPLPGGVNGQGGGVEEGGVGEYIYQIGFQVDLTRQPYAILDKLRDGSYVVQYGQDGVGGGLAGGAIGGGGGGRGLLGPTSGHSRDRRASVIPPLAMSDELKRLLADPAFVRSIPISMGTISVPPMPILGSAPTTNSTTTANTNNAMATSSAAMPSISTTQANQATATPDDSSTAPPPNHPLSLVLLEALPDFIHVVSLKGDFLYVAPSVRRVLGYEPEELVGRSIGELAHGRDVVPVLRELKEGGAMGVDQPSNVGSNATTTTMRTGGGGSAIGMPRPIDLLYRAKTKSGQYVWIESRGRLHVEPGKGRKAIVLSGRAREMGSVRWSDVSRGGGMARMVQVPSSASSAASTATAGSGSSSVGLTGSGAGSGATTGGATIRKWRDQELWGLLSSGTSRDTLVFRSVGRGVGDVLGYEPDELLGRGVLDYVDPQDEEGKEGVWGLVGRLTGTTIAMEMEGEEGRLADDRVDSVRCRMKHADGSSVDVWFVVYRADAKDDDDEDAPSNLGAITSTSVRTPTNVAPPPLVFQIRLANAEVLGPAPGSGVSAALPSSEASTPLLPSASASLQQRRSSIAPISISMPSTSTNTTSTTTSTHTTMSSLPNATSLPSFSSNLDANSSSSSHLTAKTRRRLPTETDIYDELSIGRDSSWQYELQQLRFANLKLCEELAALAGAAAGGAGSGLGSGAIGAGAGASASGLGDANTRRRSEVRSPATPVVPSHPHVQSPPSSTIYRYDPLVGYSDRRASIGYEYPGQQGSQQQQYRRHEHPQESHGQAAYPPHGYESQCPLPSSSIATHEHGQEGSYTANANADGTNPSPHAGYPVSVPARAFALRPLRGSGPSQALSSSASGLQALNRDDLAELRAASTPTTSRTTHPDWNTIASPAAGTAYPPSAMSSTSQVEARRKRPWSGVD